ncbi:conserved protein of unknown function (plasmid) [Magnetospirillum sp. XM-1]|uniref:hypothetical protein n=1 Tax=Magnetospirillum sp. XM-1 TaxID=1663591 RepID=UPI00073DD90B|nr:hypothetical protein [Magnetospirillum sp. XM-1]CUW41855.1 conserved protein of unknown function [Magnetospirillum sp. XM-1]
MKGTLTLRAAQRSPQDDEGAAPEETSVEVDNLDLKLPCRVFEVSYQVADAGKFTLTTEFLLRLLKAVNGLTEAEIAEFFGFSVDEAAEVVNAAERKEYVTRHGGKVALTEAGDSLFEGPAEEPALYEVERKRGHFGFDLVSFCPARSQQLEPFERTLPEVPLPDPELAANATKEIREAFRRHFHEIQVLLGGQDADRRSLYSIDDVTGQHRGSTLVPVSVKVGRETSATIGPDLRGWKTGVDLDNRMAVLQSCGAFLKTSIVSASYASENGADYLHECAPAHLARYFKGGQFNTLSYFRLATSMAGDLRKDRKTARIVGTLWTRQNFDRIVAAMKHAPEIPGMEHEPLIWLRPSTPLWGCSTRFVSMVEGLAKNMAPSGRPEPLGTVLIAHDDRESGRRFGDVFDVVTTLRAGRTPKNFEMLLVPGRLFAAQVHLPMSGSDGYPIAMGVVSFDHALLRGAHEVMSDIIARGKLAIVAGESRADIGEDLMEALKLPGAFGAEVPAPPSEEA